jgi:hypothetical protein
MPSIIDLTIWLENRIVNDNTLAWPCVLVIDHSTCRLFALHRSSGAPAA